MPDAIKVNCPMCGSASIYSSKNPHRPFCSERCKLIDLGAWANETYRVSDNIDEGVAQTVEVTEHRNS